MKKKNIDDIECLVKNKDHLSLEPDKANDKAEQLADQKPSESEHGKDEAVQEIPDYATDYFKRHTEMKAAYIDKLGGVFQLGTPKAFMKDAVLYQNPFYNQ